MKHSGRYVFLLLYSLFAVLFCAPGCGGGGSGLLPPINPPPSGRVCGDGVVAEKEICDDGNRSDGDGCSSACIIEFRDFGFGKWTGERAGRAASQEEEDAFGNIMEKSFITIDNVNFSTPAAGQPCAVTATLSLEDEQEEATIWSVKLIYSVNGGTENLVEMADAGGGNWTGSIPSQTRGRNVKFYIWAADSNGNVTTGGVPSRYNLVPGVPDVNNSADIVDDDADLTNIAVNYDSNYIYVAYKVEGDVTGGSVDPPYNMLYGIKFTNPDTEQGEGLMVGKLWVYMPMIPSEPELQEQLLPMLLEQGTMEQVGQENIDRIKETGMMVMDIQKLMGGNIVEGLLFSAEPEGKTSGGIFYGKIKRAPLGVNPSGYMRIIVLTAANASIDSFMPIPLNCSNFLTMYFSNYSYTVN